MRPIHWAATVAGLAAIAMGLKLLFSDPPPSNDTGDIATDEGTETSPSSRAQVQMLGGPPTRDPDEGPATLGVVRSPVETEADRRREQLLDVLKNLEGAPIYVEGVDGPSGSEPSPPTRR